VRQESVLRPAVEQPAARPNEPEARLPEQQQPALMELAARLPGAPQSLLPVARPLKPARLA